METIDEIKLKMGMTSLVEQCFNNEADYKKIIAQAVNLGMLYEKSKIKQEIDNIFK